MNDLITSADRIGSIIQRPEFAGMRQFILPMPPGILTFLLRQFRLSILRKLTPTWNVDDTVDGLNRILEIVRTGTRFHYDIWNDADKAADPRKRDTALFHFPVNTKGPFVLVCAGGAYVSVASIVEAFPVAAELNHLGFSAFVLHYRTRKDNPWPVPMEDLQQALHFILDFAGRFNIIKDGYAVVGFSAGGHLTASLGTDNFGYKKWSLPKPGALFLGYPVTMFDHMTKIHRQCRDTIIGKNPTREQIDSINVVLHADNDYPPAYLMACQDDDAVYFENSEMLVKRLKELGVPCQFKSVARGGHGIELGNDTLAQGWLTEAVQFWLSK
jgi:acetyl esterase/lipase